MVSLLLYYCVALLGFRTYAFRPGLRYSWSLRANTIDNSTVNEQAFYFHDQRLDHFTPGDRRVFKQKYFEVLDYFQPPHGPIFLVMCGESTCPADFYGRTYAGTMAKKFGAAIVILEHRYYGESSPFQNFTPDNMIYLSSKQSLFDHALFISYYQDVINKKYNMQGLSKWIVIGVSYSGALSAWFRLQFPHLVVGSWASSGVVQAVFNYSAYDKQVGISVGPDCKKLLQQITALVEEGLAKNDSTTKVMFASQNLKDDDFLSYVADGAAAAVQPGFTDELCGPLLQVKDNTTKLLEAYANFTLDNLGDSALFDTDILMQQVKQNNQEAKDVYSWTWQVCTEFAFFQVAPDKDSVRSSRVNSQYYLNTCSKLFGDLTNPEVDMTNLYYGGRNISGSRIMFLNGSQDPWRHASKQISASRGEPALVLKCHSCAHGFDIKPKCPQTANAQSCGELGKAHAFISSNLEKWLSGKEPPLINGFLEN